MPSIQSLNISMLDPGALYIQLIMTFFCFSLHISIVIHSSKLSTTVVIQSNTLKFNDTSTYIATPPPPLFFLLLYLNSYPFSSKSIPLSVLIHVSDMAIMLNRCVNLFKYSLILLKFAYILLLLKCIIDSLPFDEKSRLYWSSV